MSISILFLLFIVYSFIGWLLEIIYVIFKSNKIVNRGFLIGPYCSIYGFCVLLMVDLIKTQSTFLIFIYSILICSIVEYLTSYILEKLFNNRWWNYKNRKYNINGRICLETIIPFGILGLIVIKYINPLFICMLNSISINILNIVSFIMFLIYIVDNILSITTILSIKNDINNEDDSTEVISNIVRYKIVSFIKNKK